MSDDATLLAVQWKGYRRSDGCRPESTAATADRPAPRHRGDRPCSRPSATIDLAARKPRLSAQKQGIGGYIANLCRTCCTASQLEPGGGWGEWWDSVRVEVSSRLSR